MVVAARRHERGAREQRHRLEAEHVAVEGESPLDVAHVQVKVADDETRVCLRRRLLVGHEGQ